MFLKLPFPISFSVFIFYIIIIYIYNIYNILYKYKPLSANIARGYVKVILLKKCENSSKGKM